MRLLFLSTWHPFPPDNGSKLRVYHLLRGLAAAHDITLLSFAFGTARPDEASALDDWCERIDTVRLDPFAANRAGTLQTFLSRRPAASRPIAAMRDLAADALAKQRFDAVIASTEMMADYALQGPGELVKILEEHNSMTRWARERYDAAEGKMAGARSWASWAKQRRYESSMLRRFDLVTLVSEEDRRETAALLGTSGPPAVTIKNGVDTKWNRPGLAERQASTLVYNGSLTYQANYDAMQWFLRDIFPLIETAVPGVSLTITGSTAGAALEGLALNDKVRLTGYVDDVRIPAAEAAVCVAPIRVGGGTRLKILEAMALGTPVVATSKGAEGLEVTAGEHLLLADSAAEFAGCVVELLGDPARRRRLAGSARALVKRAYDWEQIGRQFKCLVEETVEVKRRVRAPRQAAPTK